MKRAVFAFLVILVLVSSVSSLAETTTYPNVNDASLAATYYKYLDTNGIITVSQDNNVESHVNDAGENVVTVNYSPSNGFDFSITYVNDILTSYVLSLDPSNAYVKSKATEMMLCFQMAFSGYDAKKSLAILEYLVQNIETDPVFGKVCKIEKDEYEFNLTVAPTNLLMYAIYPLAD